MLPLLFFCIRVYCYASTDRVYAVCSSQYKPRLSSGKEGRSLLFGFMSIFTIGRGGNWVEESQDVGMLLFMQGKKMMQLQFYNDLIS